MTDPNANNADAAPALGTTDPAVLKKVAAVRAHVRENFGKIVMGMMGLPRYRQQTIADLQDMLLEPLIRDRVAIAYPKEQENNELSDLAGVAIWASVSEEVDTKIREQVRAGVFPVRLKADEWQSGNINWLLDVIAPNQEMTVSVISNFKHVVKGSHLRLHPIVTKLVDAETLQKVGVSKAES